MPTNISIRHVDSPEYRTILVDNCIVTGMSDQVGDRIVVTLTRMENRTTSEPAIRTDEGGVQMIGGVSPDGEFVRVLEIAAELRPDHALALANAIRTALGKLPVERRGRYGIPSDIGNINTSGAAG